MDTVRKKVKIEVTNQCIRIYELDTENPCYQKLLHEQHYDWIVIQISKKE